MRNTILADPKSIIKTTTPQASPGRRRDSREVIRNYVKMRDGSEHCHGCRRPYYRRRVFHGRLRRRPATDQRRAGRAEALNFPSIKGNAISSAADSLTHTPNSQNGGGSGIPELNFPSIKGNAISSAADS